VRGDGLARVGPRHDGDADGWHGRRFCIMLLRLIRKKMGPEAEEYMIRCIKEHKVEFRPKNTITTRAYKKGQTPPGFEALKRWRKNNKKAIASLLRLTDNAIRS